MPSSLVSPAAMVVQLKFSPGFMGSADVTYTHSLSQTAKL